MVPSKYQIPTIRQTAHESTGHVGKEKTYHLMQTKYHWPGMYADVANYVLDCSNCQAEAKQIKEALDFLNSTHTSENMPTRLSSKRRKLIARSFMHPILDFIYRHHIIISIITAIITIAATLCILRQVKVWHNEKLKPGISVSIKHDK